MALPLTALVLAGGRSRRMGRDKALLEWQGLPLVVWVLRQAKPLCERRLLVGGAEEVWEAVRRWEPEVSWIPDRFPGAGPLAGLEAGLAASETEANLLLACDLPYLETRALRFLMERWEPERFDAVVPLIGGRWEPLHALYHRRCGGRAREVLRSGRRSMTAFLNTLRVRAVSEVEWGRAGVPLRSLTNVNEPEEWERAVRETQGQGRAESLEEGDRSRGDGP